MRVIIVAEHASSCFGGEAFIPLNFFRLLRARQVDAHLVVHARTADELRAAFPHDLARLHFTVDGRVQRALARLSLRLPRRVADTTTLFASHMCTQLAQRRLVRHLVKLYQIDVVHEPIPVSPKYPSLMWDVGAPIIIGPLNGGMEYPIAFRRQHGLV